MRAYEDLSPDELAKLVGEKREELLASSHEKTFRKMPTAAFDEHVRYVIRKELAALKAVPFERWLGEWTANS